MYKSHRIHTFLFALVLAVIGCKQQPEAVGLSAQRDTATWPIVLYVASTDDGPAGPYSGLLQHADPMTGAAVVSWGDSGTGILATTEAVPALAWLELPCVLDFGSIDPGLLPPTIGTYVSDEGAFAPATLTSRDSMTHSWTGVAYGAHGPGGDGSFADVPQCDIDLTTLDDSTGGYLVGPPSY